MIDPLLILAILCLALACVPLVIFLRNLHVYQTPACPRGDVKLPPVSVLIPARNEAATIEAALQSILANQNVTLEVIVLDDHSEDATASIVRKNAQRDSRVRLESSAPLPAGWCGKQHACHQLAGLARFPYLVFLDADVRLEPDTLARMVHYLETQRSRPRFEFLRWLGGKPPRNKPVRFALASGVPHQITATWLERLLIPLIHFVLLGFLPMRRMLASSHPSYGAGCGQFFIARRDAYLSVQPHREIRNSLHDGLQLPRAFRRAGYMTSLFDATDLARCRMYHNARETWCGLRKNAIEGLAAPTMILGMTLLLLGSQVIPWALLILTTGPVRSIALASATLSLAPRLFSAVCFRQSWFGALLHPIGIVLLLAIQWQAFFRWWLKVPNSWKGRAYGVETSSAAPAIKPAQPVQLNS